MNILGSLVRIVGIIWIIFGVLNFIAALAGAGSSGFGGILNVGLGFAALALGSALKRRSTQAQKSTVVPKTLEPGRTPPEAS